MRTWTSTGDFTMEEASGLAIVLRAGALPAPVRIVEERTVGASLGEDSIRSGLTACALGIGAVFVLPGGMSTFVNVRELLGYSTRRATNVTAGLRLAF